MLNWKKKKISEESLNGGMETVAMEENTSSLFVGKIVLAILILIEILLLVRRSVMFEPVCYNGTPVGEYGLEEVMEVCAAGELLYEGKLYKLRSAYELYAAREAIVGVEIGEIQLFGAKKFERAKEEGVYIICRDTKGNVTIELAVIDDIAYIRPAGGKCYRTWLTSKKTMLVDCAKHLQQGTHTEWIENYKKLYGAM